MVVYLQNPQPVHNFEEIKALLETKELPVSPCDLFVFVDVSKLLLSGGRKMHA